jgi:hypothetical protein
LGIAGRVGLRFQAGGEQGPRLLGRLGLLPYEPERPGCRSSEAGTGRQREEPGEGGLGIRDLSTSEVGKGEVEVGGLAARLPGDYTGEIGHRLGELALLIAGDPEAHEGIEPVGIASEGILEVARGVSIPSDLQGDPAIRIGRRAAGQQDEAQDAAPEPDAHCSALPRPIAGPRDGGVAASGPG